MLRVDRRPSHRPTTPGTASTERRTRVDVEIKVNFGESEIDKAKKVFGLDPGKAEERAIWFGEILTGRDGRDALPLLERGVILRVRAKKKSGDVTLKLRGPDGCLDVPAWTARVEGLGDAKVEGDWADHRLVSASLTAKSDRAARDDFTAGVPPITSVMSVEQTKLARELMIPVDRVELRGPIAAHKWEHEHEGGVDAEEWKVGDLHFLEISVLAKGDPEQAQRELRRWATDGGLELDEGTGTKTTLVLKYLTG
jgi:hypothetical protein